MATNAIHGVPSFTGGQDQQAIRWVSPYADEAVALLATSETAQAFLRAFRADGRPKILWACEARWLDTINAEGANLDLFDHIISNDAQRVAAGASYMTLFGTWITNPISPAKTEMVSMVDSGKWIEFSPGYTLRREVRAMLGGKSWPHGYGMGFGRKLYDKYHGLAAYRYNIAIENERYDWWMTEKLFDCMATRTVPIYWGCPDDTKLREFGYDPRGILWWETLDDLKLRLAEASERQYDSLALAIEHNYHQVWRDYAVEIRLAPVLREILGR